MRYLDDVLPSEAKVADVISREKRTLLRRTETRDGYTGKLIVLVDSRSASSARYLLERCNYKVEQRYSG